MPADDLHREYRALRADRTERQAKRYIDLCIDWEMPDGTHFFRAGGRWDQIEKRWSGEPEQSRVFRLQESQVEAARWAAYWLQERREGRDRDFLSVFLYGDRGGGKTTLGVVVLVSALIMFPDFGGGTTIGWQVSKSHAERDELDREIAALFPYQGVWYNYREWPKHVYRFVHGPTLTNVSADDPDTLKRGRVDFLFVNEAAKMGKRVPVNGIARLKDKGGFGFFTSNPPDDQRGRWVFDWWEKEREARENGQPYPVRYLRVMSSGNATKDDATADQVERAIRDIDPAKAKADIEGLMLRPGQPAYWQWSKTKNLRAKPQLGDITRQFLRSRVGREYDYLAGADFQGTPHQAAVFYKVFGTLDAPILWAVDEIVVDQATEEDLLSEVDDANYTPGSVLWIGDASGQWQDGKHSKQRDSFSVFKGRRWHILPPTKPKTTERVARNPPVEQRVKLTNKLLSDARLMVDPDTCPKLAEAFKECELRMGRYGRVIPLGFYAHLTDAAAYPIWWACSKSHRPPTGSIGESVDIPRPKVW